MTFTANGKRERPCLFFLCRFLFSVSLSNRVDLSQASCTFELSRITFTANGKREISVFLEKKWVHRPLMLMQNYSILLRN